MVGVTMIIIIFGGVSLVLNRTQSRFPFRKHCLLAAAGFFHIFSPLKALQFPGLFSHHHLQSHFLDLGNSNLFSVMSGTMSYISLQFYKP